MHQNSPPPPSTTTLQQHFQQQTPTTRDTTTTTTTTTTTIKPIYILTATTLFTLFILLTLTYPSPPLLPPPSPDPHLFPTQHQHPLLSLSTPHTTTSIAYFITGTSGDSSRIFRVLLSTYHPKNLYLLHLDSTAPQSDRDNLAFKIQSFPVFKAALNVHVIGKADFAYAKGSSPVSSLLRGASILLKLKDDWDWFINLSARDYPLVTQDDLLHILSYLPNDFNFVNHTSYIGWKESRRLKPIIVDPGLYLTEKSAMFYATQKRELPSAYQLFSGSSTSILNRKFVEFVILGSDNLPRLLLMYLANSPSSILSYIPTILCNSPEYKETVVNHSLQYASYYSSSTEDTRKLNGSDFDDMIRSGSAFGAQFRLDDPVLDRIDREILGRSRGKVIPGGWCLGEPNDACAVWGDANTLRPGPGAKRLESRLVDLLSDGAFRTQQCTVE